MAIVQISRITNRKGLQENLPQLAGAEFGWSIDERRLYIGNGTLEEGAPVIGNTEILTEFSNILEIQSTYTYKGEAAGYTVQTSPSGTPVTQSLQSWLDQFATIKDFGAVGDGVTDDTEAINWALQQIYCVQNNPQIRRGIFFPAGVYRVTETIFIPPYATLYGEGLDNTVIYLDVNTDDSTLNQYVARTTTNGGSVNPQYVTVSNMSFETRDTTADVFLVENANYCRFQNVGFFGPGTTSTLTSSANDSSGVRFASTSVLITNQIVFDGCEFSGTVYGINTASESGGTDQEIQGVTVSNSKFNTLYQGVVIGTEIPATTMGTGLRVVNNVFDNIYKEGIYIGDAILNATGHNIFYNVGNHFASIPQTPVIYINQNNNVSIGDMFERNDADALIFPRIQLNQTTSIGVTNSAQIAIGRYVRETGKTFTLASGQTNQTIFTIDASSVPAFSVDYTIRVGTNYRTGVIVVTSAGGASLTYNDDFTENASTGISLSVVQSVNTITVRYSSGGTSGTMTYSISTLA